MAETWALSSIAGFPYRGLGKLSEIMPTSLSYLDSSTTFFRIHKLICVFCFLFILTATARGGVTLAASPSPATFGAPVTLTATVSPGNATGKVTFYDGAAVLGTSTLSGGTATLRVSLNSTGIRSLTARYPGDASNSASVSTAVPETVTSVPALGFLPSDIAPGVTIADFAVADFNGDGKADVVMVGSSFASVALGNGDGTFSNPIMTQVHSGNSALVVTTGDFNGDGKLDLAVGSGYTNFGNTADVVTILLGNGDGTFGTQTNYSTQDGALAVADFNLDGIPDIVIAHPTAFGILIGRGDGTFQNPVEYSAGGSIATVAVGDVNGDGKPDLVGIVPTADQNGSMIAVLLGNGDGTFSSPNTYLLYNSAQAGNEAIVLADFNGDGKLDLGIAAALTHGVWVCMGRGDGSFASPVQFNAAGQDQGSGQGIAAVDVDGDNKLDLIADIEVRPFGSNNQGNELQTYYGNGDGTFQLAGIQAPFRTHILNKLVAADFNGDGRVDVMSWGYDFYSNMILKLFSGAMIPDMQVSATHGGDLSPGQTGTFTVVVSNAPGAASTSGTVTLNYESGLITINSMSGTGWNCTSSIQTCTRADSLAGGADYPPLTVTGSVPLSFPAPSVATNTVVVTNGSQIAEAEDVIHVVPLAPNCTFSLGSTSLSTSGSPGAGSVSVTTNAGCAWLSGSNNPWITVTAGASGTGSGTLSFQVSANPTAAARTGTITIAGLTFTVNQAAPTLAAASVSPASGSGSAQMFTFTFTDQAGFSDLSVVDVLISTFLDGQTACYFAVAPTSATTGYLYLVDDAGDGGYVNGTPMALPSANTLQNSQCSISGSGSSISANGNTLIVNLAIAFPSTFVGNKAVYMAARSSTQNSGWQAMGTWNVPGPAPSGPAVGTMTPARSPYPVGLYTFTFTDTNGFSDLFVLDILNNSALTGVAGCYIAYVPTSATTGYLYLVDDAGDGGYAQGSPISIPSNQVLLNSQCTVGGGQTTASASGNTLTLNLNIYYQPTFAGNQAFYLAARDHNTGNSGWQAVGSISPP